MEFMTAVGVIFYIYFSIIFFIFFVIFIKSLLLSTSVLLYSVVFVATNSIMKDIYRVQQNIGYCPQFDALYDELTAREHLQLYSRLRGIPPQQQAQVIRLT